jgi:hypothetical protein
MKKGVQKTIKPDDISSIPRKGSFRKTKNVKNEYQKEERKEESTFGNSLELNLTLRDIQLDSATSTTDPTLLRIQQVQKEAFLAEYCRTRKPFLLPEVLNYKEIPYDLQINMSEWSSIVDEELLIRCCSSPQIQQISLVLKDFLTLSVSFCELLNDRLGDKVVEIVFDTCFNTLSSSSSILPQQEVLRSLLLRMLNIKSLKFINLSKWFNDNIVEILTKRYKSSLEYLHFEKCHYITNNALYHIGKSISSLRNFVVICCNKLSDLGISEIAKKNHFVNVEFQHSFQIQDKSLESVLQNTNNLYSFSLVNCPNITNTTISYLHEIAASWGKRKNTSAHGIKRFIVKDNVNITEESLLWITASTQQLIEIDIRDCPSIELSKAVLELANLQHVKYLKIGSFSAEENINYKKVKDAFNFDHFMQGMIRLVPKLHHLTMVNIPHLFDEKIAEIFDNADDIRELHLIKLTELGTATVESICSTLPNLSTLEISYSNSLRDIDLRCICSVLLHLKSITLSYCPLLTDAGFTRFIVLRYLNEFHLNYLSKNVTTMVVRFLSTCPLNKISLNGIIHSLTDTSGAPNKNKLNNYNDDSITGCNLRFLRAHSRQQITSISLKDCQGKISLNDVEYLLNQFVYLEWLDLTGSPQLTSELLMTIKSTNPFLNFVANSEFVGFRLMPQDNYYRYKQYYLTIKQFQRHISAYRIQKLRRKYLLRCKELQSIRKENWQVVKEICVVKIQAVARGYLARKQLKKEKNAGKIIIRYLIKFFTLRGSLKLFTAKNFYREIILRKSFNYLNAFKTLSQRKLSEKYQKLSKISNERMVAKFWKLLKIIQIELIELHFEESAMIIYKVNFLRKILFHWKKVLSLEMLEVKSDYVKQRLVRKWLFQCVPLTHYNSVRQNRLIFQANAFAQKRLLTIAWIEMARDRLVKRRIDKMIPMAIEWSNRQFFKRVIGLCFQKGLKQYYYKRLNSKRKKLFAANYYRSRLYSLSVKQYYKYYCVRKFLHIAMEKSVPNRNNFQLRKALSERFYYHTSNSVLAKADMSKSKLYFRNKIFHDGYFIYKMGVLRDRRFREMEKIAEVSSNKLYLKKSFQGLKIYQKFNRNMDAFYYHKYLLKIARKCLISLRISVLQEKDKTNLLIMQLKQKTTSEEHFFRVMMTIKKAQAIIRGRLKFRKFQEERIQKFYAIQTLQNFLRVVIARKQFNSRIKKLEIEEKVREDYELDRMRDEEIETRYYLYKLNAVITIQRVYRGYLGRIIGKIVAFEMRKYRSKQEYLANQHLRDHHEAFLRALAAKEKIRANACAEIQRVFRGFRGRKIFRYLKYQKLVSMKAVSVQHAYQRRLAKLRLKAIKRDVLTEMRHLAAKRQRGMVLRMFGLMKRKYQTMIAPALSNLGIDPITYNYRIGELVTDTIYDFEILFNVFSREKALYKKFGILNTGDKDFERRNVLIEQGWKYKLHEAVRIIDLYHPFHGLTGIVVRIDETLLGAPLYEIRLDRYERQTHLRMTTDPIVMYEQIQPIAKIQINPQVDNPHAHRYSSIFGIDNENEFFSKKNVYAAWTIQRAFRMHRSRRIVARVRFEHWRKNINRHYSVLHHLSEANAFSYEGYRVAGYLGTQSMKPIRFNELKHKFLPQRYLSGTKKLNEMSVIKKEVDNRFRDRLTYLQKVALLGQKDAFPMGFTRLTTYQKFRSFFKLSYGLVKKGGSSVSSLFGNRNTLKLLASRQSSVIGLDRYTFKQFANSRHIRYYKTSMYQGEWTGVPLFTPLKPHGEGMIIFLDGWGFAREDKVLYLTIVRCKYLNAVEFNSSDPFADIFCNGHNLQTSVKWKNLNPEYHESFEIDVTNPQAELIIKMKSHDVLFNLFLGQVVLKLADFSDGKEHHLIQLLRGDNAKILEDFDRGEIEIRLKWSERIFEDDQIRMETKRMMLLKLQSWSRRISALVKLKNLRKEREANLIFLKKCAIKITNTCRCRLARKEYKRRSRKFKYEPLKSFHFQ